MAIQYRRGNYSNFDPSKLLPGEPAVVQSGDPSSSDGKAVYVAFAAGDVKRLATQDDIASFTTDKTLTITDKAADAKATGDAIGDLNSTTNSLEQRVDAIEDTTFAKAIIESYTGSTLANRSQSIQNALLYDRNNALTLDEGVFTDTTTQSISYTKIGRICIFQFNFNGIPTFSDSNNHTILTLPEAGRPNVSMTKLSIAQNGTPYILSFATSGAVSINLNGAAITTRTFFRDSVVYIV